MSASEKLEELLHAAETGGWDNDIHGEPLLMALPQIVAVVEAAEVFSEGSARISAEMFVARLKILRESLDALVEALS